VTNERRIVSTEQIVDAYIELVDETGPVGPTVRAVAGQLFVSPTTLYERAGPIGEVANLAAARLRHGIADQLAVLIQGDPAPIVEWVNANPNRALFAMNPHRGSDPGPHSVGAGALAIVGAFMSLDGRISNPPGLVDTVACLPAAAAIRVDDDVAERAADRAAIVLDRIEDDVLAASARLIATRGAEEWTFRSVAELLDRGVLLLARLSWH